MKKEDIDKIWQNIYAIEATLDELKETMRDYNYPKEDDSYPDRPEVTDADYNTPQDLIPIGDLNEYIEGIIIQGRIIAIGAMRTGTKKSDGSTWKVLEVTLGDKTGTIVLPLWDEDVYKMDKLNIHDVVEVHAWKVKKGWKGRMELVLGQYGQVLFIRHEQGEQHIL
jgi:hypothetical protein